MALSLVAYIHPKEDTIPLRSIVHYDDRQQHYRVRYYKDDIPQPTLTQFIVLKDEALTNAREYCNVA